MQSRICIYDGDNVSPIPCSCHPFHRAISEGRGDLNMRRRERPVVRVRRTRGPRSREDGQTPKSNGEVDGQPSDLTQDSFGLRPRSELVCCWGVGSARVRWKGAVGQGIDVQRRGDNLESLQVFRRSVLRSQREQALASSVELRAVLKKENIQG